ncbi:MAG: hypothetical protein L3J18_15525 [Candidatus Brocadia sp.]|jgi:hypothetical protein|uniref:Uncharacterized protein n=1 Tax=Candidatus Brocadia fulgida TaxID=380242 RepID=A0A0M2UZ40_9BACT|nr:MAG: hypothetical protein BROFUL_00370 [Candidatus Brocadia fulgida]MBV6517968.1 hypothetical protein [Candidatus Brocadia fulgida]MCC6325969.1 hypothetical protein [Candidatus Brocadia sp.]UJS20288.1 MAG: hypothetical protein L3J18_15525 [Candidatus Brocadia sp.]
MTGNIIPRISTDSVEAVKRAIDSVKMQGETVWSLLKIRNTHVVQEYEIAFA